MIPYFPLRSALALLLLAFPGAGPAVAQRTGSTDEIAALIEAAAPGETVRVPAGRYLGRLTIRTPVVLDGSAGAVIDGEGRGIVVEILAGGVTIRGFTVRGSGSGIDGEPAGIRAEAGPVRIEENLIEDVLFGIDLRNAPDSVIRANRVVGKPFELGRRGDGLRLWWSNGCTVEENVIRETRDAVFWYCEDLTIRGNRVVDGRYGLHFMYSHGTAVRDNILEGNSVGVYLMYSNGITLTDNLLARNRGSSGYGLGLKDCDDVTVLENRILANRVGVYIDRSPFSIDGEGLYRANVIAYNEIGMALTPQTNDNDIVANAFVENEEQVAVHGRGNLSGNRFSGDEGGNYWSDYAGFDLDRDGVGDLPYRATSLFENLLAHEPLLRLFAHGPAQQAVEFTSKALPEIRPEPKFVDPAPRMSSNVLPRAAGGGGVRVALLCVSGGLLALSAALLRGGLGRLPGEERVHGAGEGAGA